MLSNYNVVELEISYNDNQEILLYLEIKKHTFK